MQVKKIVLALASVATVTLSTAALAIDISTGVTADNQVFFTGATAQTPGIARSMNRLCVSGGGTLITLTGLDTTPVAPKPPVKLLAWKCDAGAAALFTELPGVTGPWIAYKNQGGSTDGINPLRTGGNINQIDPATCALTGTSTTTGTCTGIKAQKSHIGFTDVSQKVFAAKTGALSTWASPAVNTYVADIATGAGQGFGIVVSSALYDLMATDQGSTSTNPITPSISKSQYATIMTKSANLWSVLLPNGTTHASSPLVIARRSNTSGTQAAAELYFLNNPCSATPAPVAGSLASIGGLARTAPTAANNGTGGQSFGALPNQFIFGQEGSSDYVLDEVANTTYAIGVVSLENPQPSSSWKYLAINGTPVGVAGTPEWQRANVVAGKYDFAYESFMFRNTNSILGAALLNNLNDFTVALQVDFGTGSNLASDNGIFADPLSINAVSGPETSHYSRGGNECRTAQFVF